MFTVLKALAIAAFAAKAIAVPATTVPNAVLQTPAPATTLEARQDAAAAQATTAVVTLSDKAYTGTLQASQSVYVFSNVRFAAAPTGTRRWAMPAAATPDIRPGDGSYGYNCISNYSGSSSENEDCLFLDVYVPASTLLNANSVANTPVAVWIYGGDYVFGNKAQYPGTNFVANSGYSTIYVALNYRLGPYGFLGGPEVVQNGIMNAGLFDQLFGIAWVKDNIAAFGGLSSRITAFGQSAGAGSIEFHLTLDGGKTPLNYSSAGLLSPAFVFQLGPSAAAADFSRYASGAGCGNTPTLACLRGRSSRDLLSAAAAVQNYYNQNGIQSGISNWTPGPDGKRFFSQPALELVAGNFTPSVQSLIITHVVNESATFTPTNTTYDSDFRNYWNFFLPSAIASKGASAIASYYPIPTPDVPYLEKARLRLSIAQSFFTSNPRYLTRAYRGSSYNAVLNYGNGDHNSDGGAFQNTFPAGSTASNFQNYFYSLIRSGDPNTYREAGSPVWNKATFSDPITNVMNFTTNFISNAGVDTIYADNSTFWYNVQSVGSQCVNTGVNCT